jgi:hypothetical protein
MELMNIIHLAAYLTITKGLVDKAKKLILFPSLNLLA